MEDSLTIDRLKHLYREKYGDTAEVERLPGAGSDRIYYRLRGRNGHCVIGTYGRDIREDKCFVRLSGIFRAHGVPVPEIYASDIEHGVYLQEDLGSADLLSCLRTPQRMTLAASSLKELVRMQIVPENEWDNEVINKPFSKRMVMWDLNYFKYEFVKPAGILFDEDKLEDDFERLSQSIAGRGEHLTGFMYRDFQSRNIMIKDGKPFFIDYQGGRVGPMLYDLVSFLWQVKANFSDNERSELTDLYLRELSGVAKISEAEIRDDLDMFVLLRVLQVLGAYGFRGLVEKKAHFIESIPGALLNLADIQKRGVLDNYPELEKVVRKCVMSRFSKVERGEVLKISVFSFSYKRGYPEDLSGNGGGFMFDCRGMHNPGRYEEYKSLTGLDKPVRNFLEERGEVQDFVEKSLGIVVPTVRRYLDRGFTGLQVGFGCTGGQHRSVYCAEAFAEGIKRIYPQANVEVIHREQGIRKQI